MPASRDRQAAVFDVVGTLVDLTPARDELVSIGAPPLALEAWFQRLLHSAATTSAIGRLRPFEELARASLRSTLAQLGLDQEGGRRRFDGRPCNGGVVRRRGCAGIRCGDPDRR